MTAPPVPQVDPERPRRRQARAGALAGLLAAAVAVTTGSLVAGLTGPAGSPLIAVGQAAIDLTPSWLKSFAIREFGSQDKVVLQAGVLVVLAILAAAAGVAASRQLRLGLAGLGVLAAIGLAAAATRPHAGPADLLPILIGSAIAAAVLTALIRAAPAATTSPLPGHSGPDRAGQLAPDQTAPDLEAPDQADQAAADHSPTSQAAQRRHFLRLSLATAGGAVVAGAAGRLVTEHASVSAAERAIRLPRPARPAGPVPPGAGVAAPGASPFLTPAASFYRVDTAIVVPQVPPSSWTLRIHGMVSRELTITFDDLLRLPLIEDYITLTCVSNPVGGPYIGNGRWLGASLGALLRRAGIRAGADQLYCTSADGFTSGTPAQAVLDGRDALLAVGLNGAPLPPEHGFPARMVVPGLYGYVSATKWVTDIEVTTYAAAAAYWVQRGWAARAPIKTACRIDVPAGSAPVRPGPVTIAGVAWAQHKGIAAVEVQVDSGPWRQARLAEVPGIDCWRLWSIDWDATTGGHQIRARATDATGYTQTARVQPPAPDGATGYPSVALTVSG